MNREDYGEREGINLARMRQVEQKLTVRQFGVVVTFQHALIGQT